MCVCFISYHFSIPPCQSYCNYVYTISSLLPPPLFLLSSSSSSLYLSLSLSLSPSHQEPATAYSHLDPKKEPEEEEEDNSGYKDLGDIEPDDLIRFAYQIASGMVSLYHNILDLLSWSSCEAYTVHSS